MNSFIISCPDSDTAYKKALDMAAKYTANPAKVYSASHPDVRTVLAGQGKAKNAIAVDQVRDIVADASVVPNESDYKVYIFRDGALMNTEAQNAALKLLEEPPEYVILILIAPSASAFLPTIRSRCCEININSQSVADEASTQFALGLIEAFASGSPVQLYKYCEDNSKASIVEMKQNISRTQEIIADMLCSRRPSLGMSTQRLLEIEQLMEKCLKYLSANVSVKQVLGIIEVSI